MYSIHTPTYINIKIIIRGKIYIIIKMIKLPTFTTSLYCILTCIYNKPVEHMASSL